MTSSVTRAIEIDAPVEDVFGLTKDVDAITFAPTETGTLLTW